MALLLGLGIMFKQSSFSLFTLGTFRLEKGRIRVPAPRTAVARALVVYLASHHGREVTRERLIEVFWPHAEPQNARASLNTALWIVRQALRAAGLDPATHLGRTKAMVSWRSPTWIDRDVLIDAAARPGSKTQEQALSLYRGEFLEGDYGEWAQCERERAAAAYETILTNALTATPSTQIAWRLLQCNPYHEEAYAVIIDAYLAAGSVTRALESLHRCEVALAEIGARPSDLLFQRFLNNPGRELVISRR